MRILTNALNKILAGCCCIILAIMVACVSWQVTARFIFNAPSSTLDEFTQILFYVDDSVRRRLYRRIKKNI